MSFIVYFRKKNIWLILELREPVKITYKGTIGFIWWPSLVKKIEILKANYINNHVLLDWVRIHVSQHNMSCLIQLNFGSFVESSDISQIFTLFIFLFILQDICMMLNTYFQTSKLVSVVKSRQCWDWKKVTSQTVDQRRCLVMKTTIPGSG